MMALFHKAQLQQLLLIKLHQVWRLLLVQLLRQNKLQQVQQPQLRPLLMILPLVLLPQLLQMLIKLYHQVQLPQALVQKNQVYKLLMAFLILFLDKQHNNHKIMLLEHLLQLQLQLLLNKLQQSIKLLQ